MSYLDDYELYYKCPDKRHLRCRAFLETSVAKDEVQFLGRSFNRIWRHKQLFFVVCDIQVGILGKLKSAGVVKTVEAQRGRSNLNEECVSCLSIPRPEHHLPGRRMRGRRDVGWRKVEQRSLIPLVRALLPIPIIKQPMRSQLLGHIRAYTPPAHVSAPTKSSASVASSLHTHSHSKNSAPTPCSRSRAPQTRAQGDPTARA
ncbi:hypothetical protein B0H19DRAFT_1131126 [Mycena capillaripes]|nr:hypothetical protein B0H19DRAFT_1131126 [Mycena capillaripes]